MKSKYIAVIFLISIFASQVFSVSAMGFPPLSDTIKPLTAQENTEPARAESLPSAPRDSTVESPTGWEPQTGQSAITTDPPMSVQWTSIQSVPASLWGYNLAAARGRIYTVGGGDATPTWEYNPQSNQWLKISDMPYNTWQNPSVATLGDSIYVVAGYAGTSSLGETEEAVVNGPSGVWNFIAPVSVARWGNAIIGAGNGRVYTAGGYGSAYGEAGYRNIVEEYNPATNQWTVKAPLPTGEDGLVGAQATNGKIYVMGGGPHSWSTLPGNVNYEYDIAANSWTTKSSMAQNPNLVALAALPNGHLLGIGATQLVDYNPASDTWFVVGALPTGTLWAGVLGQDGKVYIAIEQDGAINFYQGTLTLAPQKAWTLMYFLAEDNDIESLQTAQYELLREASNNLNVNIVAFADSKTTLARYVVFSPGGGTSIVKGELSTGNPNTLRDFVQWAQQNYPASHYSLSIVDHGQGHTGVAADEDAPDDVEDCRGAGGATACLTLTELRQALSSVTKLDVIEMNTCTLATIEAAYQLRGLADYYVASEETVWVGIMPHWLTLGHQGKVGTKDISIPPMNSSTTPEQLAIAMAQSYYLNVNAGRLPGTISVARLSNVSDVVTKASALAALLKGQMSSLKNTVSTIKTDVQHFNSNGDNYSNTSDEIVDLYHFAQLVKLRVSDVNIKSAATELMTAIDGYIIGGDLYERNWGSGVEFIYQGRENVWHVENSRGVSIFFPSFSRSFYKENWFDFAVGTTWNITGLSVQTSNTAIEWGPMLVEYVRQTNPGAIDDPNPPALIAPMIPVYYVYLPVVLKNYVFVPPIPITPPSVESIVRAGTNPASTASVDFTVTFSEIVTGVDLTDFTLTTSGVAGAFVSSTIGSGTSYTVTVDTGSGNGTIRLDVIDDDTIQDATGDLLAGGYTGGETYTISRESPPALCSPDQTIIDPAGDVSPAYIDVTTLSTVLNGESLQATLHLNDVPSQLTFNQTGVPQYYVEYEWSVYVDVDNNPQTGDSYDWYQGAEYTLSTRHIVWELTSPITQPIADGVETYVWLYDSTGNYWSTHESATLNVDSLSNIMTITGTIPGINANSRLVFFTYDYNPGSAYQNDTSTCSVTTGLVSEFMKAVTQQGDNGAAQRWVFEHDR